MGILRSADRCSLYAATATPAASGLYEPVNLETALNDCCGHLLTTLGLAALYPQHSRP